jgi:hypothetical protein
VLLCVASRLVGGGSRLPHLAEIDSGQSSGFGFFENFHPAREYSTVVMETAPPLPKESTIDTTPFGRPQASIHRPKILR